MDRGAAARSAVRALRQYITPVHLCQETVAGPVKNLLYKRKYILAQDRLMCYNRGSIIPVCIRLTADGYIARSDRPAS